VGQASGCIPESITTHNLEGCCTPGSHAAAHRETAADLNFGTVDLDKILASLDDPVRANIIILDACRGNPLARSFATRTRTANVGAGLAAYTALGTGTLIAYSTAPGKVAEDGRAANSPFTTSLIRHIPTPGIEIRQMLTRVRADVARATGDKQIPWDNSSLRGDVYLAGPPAVTLAADEIAWDSLVGTTDRAALRRFLDAYPLSRHRAEALSAIERLGPARPAVVAPPVTPSTSGAATLVQPAVSPAISSSACGPGPVLVALSSRPAQPLSLAEECALHPKDSFKECDICPEMVVVPPGGFSMGSPNDEKERWPNEGPRHEVTFARPFAVGRFSVTFEEWDACVAAGGCGGYKPHDRGWGRGRRPVIDVSWQDAKAYVAWLSSKTGQTYRLLSEAEREYVTRAGSSTPFWWGASASTQQANYDGSYSYAASAKGENRRRTLPVDSFAPNPWGLYQVQGNSWDWTEDCFHNDYVGAPSDGSAWTSGDCAGRVLRGGSFMNTASFIRAAMRGRATPGNRNDPYAYGLRVARTMILP
jgi:formylglycine-generating enzyme required for sulfatase activity